MMHFFQFLQFYGQLILLFIFIFLGSDTKGIQSFRETITGFIKATKMVGRQSSENVPADPRTNEEKKKG